jgi:spore maturation protein SpmB
MPPGDNACIVRVQQARDEGVVKTNHTVFLGMKGLPCLIAAGLLADLAGVIASVVICRLVFG